MMFVLDPVNSITSVEFYRKVARQSGLRTAAYLAYVAVLFSVAAAFAVKVKIGPAVDQTFVWLERSVPEMVFADGKMISKVLTPMTIRHPEYPDLALTIDTTRAQPVTPQLLEEQKLSAYLTSDTLYLMQQNGDLKVLSLSRSKTERPVKIDPAFFESARRLLARLLYPVAFAVALGLFLIWKTLASLLYSLVALAVNSSANAGLPYGALFSIAVYAQSLIILLQAIFLFMPVGMPAAPLLSLVSTGIYIWLAVKRVQQAELPQAPAV